MSGLHFIRPMWLLAVLALPLLAFAIRRIDSAGGSWRQVVDPELLRAQGERSGGGRLRMWLASGIWMLAVLAMAGPSWRQAEQPLEKREAALVVAISLSPSMLDQDLKPDRLARARFKVEDLLRERRDGQFALLAFSGDAFTVAPITDDSGTLSELLDPLDPSLMPAAGDRGDLAIDRAVELLKDAGFVRGRILLLADRVDPRAVARSKAAAAQGFPVSVIGVGSDQPTPVAKPEGGFLQDEHGGILLPKIDDAALQAVAEAGDGGYLRIRSDASDLRTLGMLDVDASAEGNRSVESERDRLAWQDDGIWLVVLLLPLAALGFRRGWLGVFMLMALLPAQEPRAQSWEGLWQRQDQRAWEALKTEDNAKARTLAETPEQAGSAAYREGDYDAAADQFARSDSADANYNRGNALAKSGKLQEALDAYDAALDEQPGMADAETNRKLVEQALQQQKQQEQQQKGSSDKNQKGDQKDSSGSQSKEDQQQGDQQNGEQQDGQQSDQNGQQQQQDQQRQGQQGSGQKDDDSSDQSSAEDNDQKAADDKAQQEYQKKMQQALDKDGQQKGKPDPSKQQAQRVAQAEEDPSQREAHQRMERLLRQVPDDPGGLLRRKFYLEYQRRRQQGEEPQP